MIKVTNHAVERYSQRILGRPNSTFKSMSSEEQENIRKKIISYITDKNILYDQLPYRNEDGYVSTTDIYLYKNIIPIYDREAQTVITIYNIDLGFDDSINEKYSKVLKDKINQIKSMKSKNVEECTDKIRGCTSFIEEQETEITKLEEEIAKLKDDIKKRKTAINETRKIRSKLYTKRKELEDSMDDEVRNLVITMIKRK
jgi:hypothetical protein